MKLEADVPHEVFAWIAGVIAAGIGWVIRVVYTRSSERIDALDRRVQVMEKGIMEEHRVRQLILDAVAPLKESHDDIKSDLNRILDILMRHQLKEDNKTRRGGGS